MTSSEVMSVEKKKNKVLATVKVNGKEEVIDLYPDYKSQEHRYQDP